MGEYRDKDDVISLIPFQSTILYVILLSSLIGIMGVSLISPLLPELRPVFHVSDAQIGLFITIYSVPGIFITPFIGYTADRIGRKWVLVPLLFTFGLAGSGIAFTTNFTVALSLRFFQGIGATALIMLAATLVGDLYEGTQRDALVGVNASMVGVGAAFYPLLGGALSIIHWNTPFLFFGIAIFIGLLALVALNESTGATEVRINTYVSRIYAVVRLPQALALFAVIFCIFFIYYGVVITALPLLLSDEFGLTSSQIGLVLGMVAVANTITSSLYGRVSKRKTAPELISMGFIAFGSSLLLIWFASTAVSIATVLLIFGVGLGLTLPAIDTKVITLVSEDLRAGIMGIRTSMLRFGQTIGPIGFTFNAETFFSTTVSGYWSLILLTGSIVTVAGSISYILFSHN